MLFEATFEPVELVSNLASLAFEPSRVAYNCVMLNRKQESAEQSPEPFDTTLYLEHRTRPAFRQRPVDPNFPL